MPNNTDNIDMSEWEDITPKEIKSNEWEDITPKKIKPEPKETIISRKEAESVPEYGIKNPNLYASIETTKKFAKGMGEEIVNLWNVAKHPIKTADNLIGLTRGLAQYIPMKITGGTPEDEQYKQTRYVEELGKNLGEYIYNSYGTYDNFKKQVNDNPVKIMRDLSTVLAISGKLASGIGLEETSKALGFAGEISAPQYLPETAVKGTIKGIAPLGKTLYGKTVGKFPLDTQLAEKERIINAGYKNEIPISRSGVLKVEDLKTELGKQIDDIIDEGSLSSKNTFGKPVPVYINKQRVLEKLEEFKDSKYVAGSHDVEGARAIIDDVRDKFLVSHPDKISLKEAQSIKQALQKEVANSYDEFSNFKKEAIKQEAYGMRLEIEKKVPNIIPVNIQQKDMIDFSEKLLREVNRF